MTTSAPFCDPALIANLRADFEAADYTIGGVGQFLGQPTAAATRRGQPEAAWTVSSQSEEPVAILLRCLGLGVPVAGETLQSALPKTGVDGALRLGLCQLVGKELRPQLSVRPYRDQDAIGTLRGWLACDFGPAVAYRPLSADHVLGPGGAARTLVDLTIPNRVGATLDLGTGCGIQLLHAARHSDRVVGSDISARALRFARFNMEINEVDCQLREGDMLSAVAGEQFDLVVANPPFVISPAGIPHYDYRNSGAPGDRLVADLMTQLPDALAPGGIAQLLGNWEHLHQVDWVERVSAWLPDDLDAWIIERDLLDPLEYATTWLRDGGLFPQVDRCSYVRSLTAYREDFARRNVEGVGLGMVILHRPRTARSTWRRIEHLTSRGNGTLGQHVATVLAAVDWLAADDDADHFAQTRFLLAPDVTEERHHLPGQAEPAVIVLRQGGGFARTVRTSTATTAFVGACDGELSAAQIIAALGELLARPVAELASEIIPQITDLVADGMLTIAA